MTAVIVLLVVLLIFYIVSKITLHNNIIEIRDAIKDLTRETEALKRRIDTQETIAAYTKKTWERSAEPEVKPQAAAPPPPPKEVKPPVASTPTPQPPTPRPMPQYEPQMVMEEAEEENWYSRWKNNNPDWEKFVGENLVNKIGIAVLVLGIAFFVKYAIDKEWINEVGRVAIGLGCGVILTGLAHRLRNSYRSFSSVLAGGGIAVFYFSIAFAFHEYALLSQTAAFLVMVAITGFAVSLSVLYDRIELAVIAAVGGFLTPFLVSTGEGNYIVLFSYLLILNSGLLALAYFKRWFPLNVIALGLTAFIFAGWLLVTLDDGNKAVSFPLVLLFLTAFYFVFLGMNTIYQVRKNEDFKPFDFSILLFLNAGYFSAGMIVLKQIDGGQLQGLFTLFAGFVNLALAAWFFKRQGSFRNLLYLLIGLTLTYLSLSVPVQLDGHAITLFWSAEFVLLYWLYQRSRISMFYFSSLLVMVIAFISLMMDWGQVLTNTTGVLRLIFTDLKGIVTNIVSIASFAVFAILVKREKEEPPFVSNLALHRGAVLAAIVLTYLTAVYGVNLFFKDHSTYAIANVYHRLVTEISIIGFISWLLRQKLQVRVHLLLAAVVLYIFLHLFSFGLIAEMREEVLAGTRSFIHLVIHALTVGVFLSLLIHTLNSVRITEHLSVSKNKISWVVSFLMVIFFSHECLHAFRIFFSEADSRAAIGEMYARAGLTVVWALCSFALMWLGMKYKTKTLRIISLSLFGLALIKLFFFDLVGISPAGKIIAFTLLGILLLTISFMYQKLKKIITEDA